MHYILREDGILIVEIPDNKKAIDYLKNVEPRDEAEKQYIAYLVARLERRKST